MDISDIVKILKKNIAMIAIVTIVCGGLAAARAFMSPKVYESSAVLLLQQQSGISLGAAGALLGIPSVAQQGLSPEFFRVIATSKTIAFAVIDKLELRNNPHFAASDDDDDDLLMKFNKNLKVEPETITVKITFAGLDPTLAANVANEIAEQTIDFVRKSALKNFEDYDKMLVMYQEQLKNIEMKIKDYEKRHGVIQIEAQMTQAIDTAAMYNLRIAERQTELESLAAVIEHTTNLDLWTQTSQRMEALKDEIRFYKIKNIEIEKEMRSAPQMKLEYMELLREQKMISLKLATIDSQRDMSMFESERLGGKMRILDPATPSKTPARPKKKLIVAFGLAFGLFASTSFAFAGHMLKSAAAADISNSQAS
ncbi:MAG TPA: Wzz/FepE/Etk N-terminal domain-containing protein [bacterium]|nr:Wzz/FepE/Etk N-terminal domain-containing protein [bacterium]